MPRASWLCLVYHEVLGESPQPGSTDYFAVSAEAFGAQLAWLQENGLRGCHLSAAVEGGDASTVAITFDDGTIGHFEHALQTLIAHGMTATFFVTTSWVGTPGHVSWDQLRAMRDAGMEIGSHTDTHPMLSLVGATHVERELTHAKRKLDEELAQETATLALPGGDFPVAAGRGALHGAGHRVVATSRWGSNRPSPGSSGPVFVNRCTVRCDTDLGTFRDIIRRRPATWWRHQLSYGVKDALKAAVGRARYARWRRAFLDR